MGCVFAPLFCTSLFVTSEKPNGNVGQNSHNEPPCHERHFMKANGLAIVASLLISPLAQALDLPIFGAWPQNEWAAQEAASKYDFRGIVALSNCSGSIVRFDDSKDTDKAMVLSNGHCVGMLKPGSATINKPTRSVFTVLDQSAGKLGQVFAEKIIYATMTKTDASLFLLKETFQDIENKFAIKALTLSRKAPPTTMPIEIISGYWKRGYSCQIETYVSVLKEAEWVWTDSLRYSRPGCETIGGTSGSPVIEAGTRTVVAVNNTGNESGQKCTMNNPCEISEDGDQKAYKGYSYAQQTYWFYGCRNGLGEFDATQPECVLPK